MNKKIFTFFTALTAIILGCHFTGVIDLTDNNCNLSKMHDTEKFQKECVEQSPNGKIFKLWSK